jgi:aspartate/methionine/tyrosine aminotransferase
VRCHTPRGAFYVFPDVSETGWNERDLAHALLQEVGVAVLPGTSFGPGGAGHLRLSYSNSVQALSTAAQRLGTFLQAPVAG